MAHMTPYDVPAEADIGRPPLSSENGGEESMQAFIQHHIISVLRPVADNVRELQQQMMHVMKDMAVTDAKVDENKASLGKVDQELLALRNSHGDTVSSLQKTNVELVKEAEMRGKLEREHEATKSALAKAHERHQHCSAGLEGVERRAARLGAGLEALKGSVANAETAIEGHLKSLAQVKDGQDDLTTRHMAAAGKLELAAEQAEATERDLQRLMKGHQREAEETALVLENLSTHMRQLHGMLDNTRDAAEKQGAELKQTTAHVHSIRATLEHKNGVSMRLEAMAAKDEEIGAAFRKHLESFERLQRIVEGLNGGTTTGGSNDNTNHHSSGFELLEELRLKVDVHDADIGKFGKNQAEQGEQLKDAILTIERLQRDQQRMRVQAEGAAEELVGLKTSHKNATNRIDIHALEQQRLQSDVQVMGKDIDTNLHQVRGDLGSASASLSRLRSHCEASNTNMFGLAKGFQDAGKYVLSGEGGLAPPPSSRFLRGLPALETRTPRGGTVKAFGETPRPQPPSLP